MQWSPNRYDFNTIVLNMNLALMPPVYGSDGHAMACWSSPGDAS
jgi:hypothetical protein